MKKETKTEKTTLRETYFLDKNKFCKEEVIEIRKTTASVYKNPPKYLKRDFYIRDKSGLITSLEGCPEKVNNLFVEESRHLTSLEGSPKKIVYLFSVWYCPLLKTLKGGPEEVGSFDCTLTSIKNLIGAPKKIRNRFDCSDNKLISLEGCPKDFKGSLVCRNNKLTSLDEAPEEAKEIWCSGNPLSGKYLLEFSTKRPNTKIYHNGARYWKGIFDTGFEE